MSKEEWQIRSLRRFAIARESMLQTLAAVQYLITSGIPKEDPVYTLLITGVCVAYARPFISSNGLGPLPNEFSKFTDTQLSKTHRDLISSRHSVHAHYSPDEAAEFLETEEMRDRQRKVEVHFNKRGDLNIVIPSITWQEARLSRIADLVQFQVDRLLKAGLPIIQDLASGKRWPAGVYVLGESFP